MNQLTAVFLLFTWYAGIVLAKGFWSTLAACFIPMWAWILVVEKLMILAQLAQ